MSEAYQSLIPAMLRYEGAMAGIVLTIGICIAVAAVLWPRMPRFRAIIGHISRVAVPLYVAPLNPLLALLATPAGFVPMPRRVSRPMLWIGLLAAALRVPHLFENLWYDETFSARMARMDWSQFWAATTQDIHPPLHNLLLMLWGKIGGYSALWLRLPELGFGLLSVFLMYFAARALRLDKATSALAAAVVALLPGAIYFGVELRAYALLSCIALGLLLSVLRNRPRWFVPLAVLMFLVHHYGLFYAVVMAGAGFVYWRSRRWFTAGAVVAAAMLVWLPNVVGQSGAVSDGFWIFNSPGGIVTSFVDVLTKLPGEYNALTAPAAVVLFVSLYTARKWLRTRPALLWAAFVFGVPALAAVISYLYVPVYVGRYLYPSMIGLAVPIAIAVKKSQLVGRVGLAFALVGIGIGFDHPRTPFSQLAGQYCPSATAYYHLTLEAAFILSHVAPDAAHLVLPSATDQGAGLTPDDIPVFGFETGDIEQLRGQSVCVMAIDSALTADYERWWLRWLQSSCS